MGRLNAVGYPLAFGDKGSAFSRKQADMNRERQTFFSFFSPCGEVTAISSPAAALPL